MYMSLLPNSSTRLRPSRPEQDRQAQPAPRRLAWPPGEVPIVRAAKAAFTAPQLAEDDDERHDERSAYSMEPSTAESMTCPAVRTTNMSPRPW